MCACKVHSFSSVLLQTEWNISKLCTRHPDDLEEERTAFVEFSILTISYVYDTQGNKRRLVVLVITWVSLISKAIK